MGTVPPEFRVIVERCLRLVRRWRTPPNWSRADWLTEADALITASGWSAFSDYDAGAAVPLGMFIARRALASALTFYRREWAYSNRCVPLPCQFTDGPSSPCSCCGLRRPTLSAADGTVATDWLCPLSTEAGGAGDPSLADALAALSQPDRTIMRRLYWQDLTEQEIASALGISQQAVSKRKRRALHVLRQRLAESSSRFCESRL